PNLTALFDHLGVPTVPTAMSFSVSLDDGAFEYGGGGLPALFAQGSNLVRPRFWSMLRDLLRFYREAPGFLRGPPAGGLTLGDYLDAHGYGEPFVADHLLPMAAAIWSSPAADMRRHDAAEFIRFCDNHGLLKLAGRPQWRTVAGGSAAYVDRLAARLGPAVLTGNAARAVRRTGDGVLVEDARGEVRRFDHVVVATHAPQALALLADADGEERRLLSAFATRPNIAVLHTDAALMPRRRAVWSAWNYLKSRHSDGGAVSVSYWMNRLQPLATRTPLFLTLNPACEPRADTVLGEFVYHHPLFDAATALARRELWSLQGRRGTWFCGAWFGAGFHEDGLQAGLAVAERLGGVRRPWTVRDESGRIHLGAPPRPVAAVAA
ncbi:NAD(P)/FAD-dependent oxidoreductase, partial [Arenibaculum sp.]|uniref:NAD(P)/FAD-dependent oxidoreductase n=1 Tax=Arenibaculum sp. TaxID=2865862 RepID=UPI002E1264A2|nr:FAD-dependent oxidoreductase [Arenibaculum sp.]